MGVAKKVYDVKSGQQIKTANLAISSAHHGVGFAATSLSICETSSVSTLKGTSNERLDTFFVNLHCIKC